MGFKVSETANHLTKMLAVLISRTWLTTDTYKYKAHME